MKFPEINPIDAKFGVAAQQRWDNLIKPRGSLGRLEEVVVRLCGIQQTTMPDVTRKRLCIFAGDHGVVAENVSAYPQSVTREMVRGFLKGHAAICVLARSVGIELEVIDAGITRNFLREPAMTVQQTEFAIQAGIEVAGRAAEAGTQLLAGGEMGIGNSTSASAIYSALFDLDPNDVTGFGAGVTNAGREHKIAVIRRSLERWNREPDHPLEILRQFGGFEIAGLVGLYLGAAASKIAVVIDGFICGAAAAIALALEPSAVDYFFFAHQSGETGAQIPLGRMGARPLLDLQLRLGEGTGAALAMQLLEIAVRLYRDMPTFEEAEVSRNLS